jgi:hypothetical protein
MDLAQHNMIVNFIWGIADECLRDVYVRGKNFIRFLGASVAMYKNDLDEDGQVDFKGKAKSFVWNYISWLPFCPTPTIPGRNYRFS